MTTQLEQIATLALAATDAQAALRDAVAKAVSVGIPVSDVALAADVTRQTVYRWASDVAFAADADRQTAYGWAGDRAREVLDVRETLGRALTLLAGLVGPTNARTVSRRASGSVDVQVLGMKIAMSSLDRSALDSLPDDEKATIKTAAMVATEARRRFDATGVWPKSIDSDPSAAPEPPSGQGASR